MGKGPLLILVFGLLLVILYLVLFGFSSDKMVRIGQYAALIVISFCIIDEYFKKGS